MKNKDRVMGKNGIRGGKKRGLCIQGTLPSASLALERGNAILADSFA